MACWGCGSIRDCERYRPHQPGAVGRIHVQGATVAGTDDRPQCGRADRERRHTVRAGHSGPRPRRGQRLIPVGLHLGRRGRRRGVSTRRHRTGGAARLSCHRRQRDGRRDRPAPPGHAAIQINLGLPPGRFRRGRGSGCGRALRPRQRRAVRLAGAAGPPFRCRGRVRLRAKVPAALCRPAEDPGPATGGVVAPGCGGLGGAADHRPRLSGGAVPRRPAEPCGAGGTRPRLRQLRHAHDLTIADLRPVAADARLRRPAWKRSWPSRRSPFRCRSSWLCPCASLPRGCSGRAPASGCC